jgi:hypothetical protein
VPTSCGSCAIGPGDCLPYRASRFNYPNDDPTALFQTITYACGQNRAALFVTDNEVSTVIRLNFLAQRGGPAPSDWLVRRSRRYSDVIV